jgi:hypothetical protein
MLSPKAQSENGISIGKGIKGSRGNKEREHTGERERERETESEIDYFLTQDDCVQRCVHTGDAIGHQDGTPDFSGPPTDKIINTEYMRHTHPSVRPSVRPSWLAG